MEFFDTYSSPDCSATSHAKGFLAKMESFDFLFFLNFVIDILGPVEILNTELQSPQLSVVDSYKKINLMIEMLEKTKGTRFDTIWKDTEREKEFEILEPRLPRKRKACAKLGDRSAQLTPITPKSHYFGIYEKCFESILNSFGTRFNKDNQKIQKSLEKFLLDKECADEKLAIENLYKADFNFNDLYVHRTMFFEFLKIRQCEVKCLNDIVIFFRNNKETPGLSPLYSKFVRLLLTIPGSSCTNERSFSLMNRIKTYLRSTMAQERLNDIAILATYKDMAENINMDEVMDLFINRNSMRKATFAIK